MMQGSPLPEHPSTPSPRLGPSPPHNLSAMDASDSDDEDTESQTAFSFSDPEADHVVVSQLCLCDKGTFPDHLFNE